MRRSCVMAVLAVALVLQGTYAAHPIDISETGVDSIQPMSVAAEQVTSDPSRELLSSNYPPPPPAEDLAEVQGSRDWPSISNSLNLDLDSAANATQFVDDIGEVVRLSRQQVEDAIPSRKLQRDMTSSAFVFASTYLSVALGTSQAEDGKTEVSASENSVNMMTTLYYTEGTSDEKMKADATTFRTTVDNNRDLVLTQNQWDALKDNYGITTDRATFLDAVTNEENFTIDGAAALKSSVLMGVAAVLSALLLA